MTIRSAAVLALLLGTAAAARAQQPQTRIPATLTLEEALRIAREHSPAYRRMLNDLDVAGAAVRQGWAAFLPTLNTSLSFSGSSSTSYTAIDPLGRPLSEPVAVTTETSSASQGASMGFTLFNGGQMFHQYGRARASERRVEASVRQQAAAIEANIKRQYFVTRQRDMLLEVERRNLTAARARLERNEQLFRLAAFSQVDLLGAQQDVINSETRLSDAESESRKARLQLQELLGVQGAFDFELSGDLPEVFDPSVLNADQLVAQALGSSPSVLQSRAALEEARRSASAQRGSRWPTISGGLSFGRSGSERGYGAIGELNPRNRSLGFSLGVSLPLFTRFQTSVSIAQAEASADDAAHDLRQVQLQTEREVRAAVVDLERTYRGLRAAEEVARLAARRLELAEERFRTGAQDMNFIQLQAIVDANATAERQVVDARFAFLNARVALEERLGAPVR